MNRIRPEQLTIIMGVPPKVDKSARAAIDLEMFHQDKKRLHRPHGDFASLACTLDGNTVYIITDETLIKNFLENIQDAVWMFHNAQYDIRQLRRFVPIPDHERTWDTMLVEQVMFGGYYDTFSLADVARRWLDIYLDKDTRSLFQDSDSLSPEMIAYAAIDVVVDWRVYKKQREAIDADDLHVYRDIDLPAMWVVLGMKGAKIDVAKWQALAEQNEIQASEIKANLDPINPASPKQVKAELNRLGYPVDSTGEEELAKIQDECDFAKEILLYRMHSKRASTYGMSFLEDSVEEDSRVYASFSINGAETGRMSCSKPNLQNQPHDKEYRECYIAGEGHVLVIADYSAQEPRVVTFLAQDEKMAEIFRSGKDIYIEIAREALGEVITKDSPRRKQVKAMVLGSLYGISEYGLSRRYDIPLEDGRTMLDSFFNTFTGIKSWVEAQGRAKNYVTTIHGRKIWLNKYMSQWERVVRNAPVQGSSADMLKMAMARFVKRWGANCILLPVHDELVLEVDELFADTAKKMLEEVMLEVANEAHPSIPAKVEIFIGKNWGVKS